MLDMIPMDCVYINSLNFLVGVVQQLLLLAWAVLGSPHVVGSGIDPEPVDSGDDPDPAFDAPRALL